MSKDLALAVAFSIVILGTANGADKGKRRKISIDTSGVVCSICAEVIAYSFQKHKVLLTSGRDSFLLGGEGGAGYGPKANGGQRPVRSTASILSGTDLGKLAKSVSMADTPHKSQKPPTLSLVLSAKLDEESAEVAEDALSKVNGVDAKKTKASDKHNEIIVRFTGNAKVTVDDILDALKAAKINAKTTVKRRARKKRRTRR